MSQIKSYTTNFSMKIPDFNIATWHDAMEYNFTLIDALLGNFFEVNNFKGPWLIVTSYHADDIIYVDAEDDQYVGKIFKVLQDHISGNTSFEEFYTEHPEYYEEYADMNGVVNYFNTAKDYAIKMDGKVVENGVAIDYSSKYYANEAATSATNANTSELNAQGYKQDAESAKNSAQSYANNAQGYMNNAEQYKDDAYSSKLAAASSENNAASSATSASNSAISAANSVTSAQTAESNAQGYANSASGSASAASSSANDALSYKNDAQSYANSAASYDSTYQQYLEDTQEASNDAQTAASGASTAKDNAVTWAQGTDEEVAALGGEHSAKGWAELIDADLSDYTKTADLANVALSNDYEDLNNKPTIPTQASDVGALPSTTKYGAKISLSINNTTYVITAQLKDQDGNNLGSAQTIDLPLESVVVSGSYDDATKKIVLTLQNGSTVAFSVADLVSGLQSEITNDNKLDADLVDDTTSTNKFVTTSDKSTWNGKQDALGYTAENSANKVTSLSDESTDTQYPSAKCVYDGLGTKANSSDLPTNFVGTDGVDDGEAGLVPAPDTYHYGCVLKSDGTWGNIDYSEIQNPPTIPTSTDYWTVGTQGVSSYQTTYSKKTIFYTASGAQDNGLKVLSSSDTAPSSTVGAWSGRCLFGNEKRTFLLGTARNSASGSQSICGIGAHTWGSASSQTSAAWDNIYIQPDGSTAVYIGGNGWRGSSGWLRVSNNNSGSASYRTSINTGTNSSPAWKTVLPNNATGTNSILFTPTVTTTHTYTYATSVNGTVTANYGTSYGYGTTAAGYATALGYNAKATGSGSIQIGQGTNSTANTLYVGLSSSLNVQLLDSSGVIPAGRLNIASSVSSSSTNSQMVGAKLFYDTCGDIETLINAL